MKLKHLLLAGLMSLGFVTSCGGETQPLTITYDGETNFDFNEKVLSSDIQLKMDRTLASNESIDPSAYIGGSCGGNNAGVKHTTITCKDKEININFTFHGSTYYNEPLSGSSCYITYKVKLLKDGYKEFTSFTLPKLTFNWNYNKGE